MHWGTFSLALHVWDQPAEKLVELAPRYDAQLVMPRLGEPVEPSHAERAAPSWWRAVDGTGAVAPPHEEEETELSAGVPWPLD